MVDGSQPHTCQVLICGSGCAGSLLAWILARQGFDVVLIDRGRHPRFAIGESSTPLADFLLEQISERYDLPELKPLARWGSWQRAHPQLRCGKKRGFSYFGHAPHAQFSDDSQHSRSLLVAASTSDEVSDTHWMRSDVDQWLCQQACAAGAAYREAMHITSIERAASLWRVAGTCDGRPQEWNCRWLVDATGNAGVVPQAVGAKRCDDQLLTQTGSIFGHFTGVQPMTDWLHAHGFDGAEDPFDGDDAAQHHVLEDGWMWMLRFDCGITSVGITRPSSLWKVEGINNIEQAWREQLQRYPTLDELMRYAELIGPVTPASSPGAPALGWIPRISRLWDSGGGAGWLALPSTVGIIDPLHSTGIAHALSGVQRAAEILLQRDGSTAQAQLLARYDDDVVDEVRWIDQLVSACYAGLPDFELFSAASNFYFLGAIESERDLRSTGELKHGFLGARRREWRELVSESTERIKACAAASSSMQQKTRLIDQLRKQIEPWNQAGLLNPEQRNRYSRSAAPK